MPLRLLLWLSAALLLFGCGSDLKERTVSDVTLIETSRSKLDTDEALAGLATAAPRGVFFIERDVYDANLVARDLERIERFYRSHGYYDVKVVAARVETVGERKVVIEIHVTPGPRVMVRRSDYPGLAEQIGVGIIVTAVPEADKIQVGKPFEEQNLDRQKRAIEKALQEKGFAYAKVEVKAKVDLSARAADVVTEVKAGRKARFGTIRIVGLKQVPERKVRALLDLHEGADYADEELDDARQALGETQLFKRAEITPDLSDPDREDVPILVTLQEDKLRELTLGGGILLDSLKLEAHVKTGWEHKNFMGGARRLSLDGTLGVDAFPTRFDTSVNPKPTNFFLVAQSSVRLEQPALFNGRTKGSAEARYSRRPVLYSLPEGTEPRNEVVIGYHSPSGTLSLQRSYFGQQIYLEPSYNLLARVPFSYQNQIPRGLETVWVSYPRIYAKFETSGRELAKLLNLPGVDDAAKRDLVISFRNSLEVAGFKVGGKRLLGGSLSDVKIEPEFRLVFPLYSKRLQPEQTNATVSLAFRTKLGFILAPDYGSTLTQGPAETESDISSPAALSDQQKLLARAFYSGGSTSNRGYAARAISPHGPVGFLLPTRVNCVLNADDPSCIRPLGGFTLWEASLELRFAGLYPISIVAFADASDVSREIGVIRTKFPHLSVGPGVRYESPVGPIRLDLGIRVPGAQALGQDALPGARPPAPGQPAEPATHGKETPTLGGFPGALFLAFGEAF